MSELETWFAVQQWLAREARLLDGRQFDQWLELLHRDVRYRIPDRSYRTQTEPRDFATWSVDAEIAPEHGLAFVDDDLGGLQRRVARLQSAMAWAETPASMTRRLVGDVIVDSDDGATLSVVSALFVVKARRDERVLLTAERRDRLAIATNGYQLRERLVVLDAVELPTENLSLIL